MSDAEVYVEVARALDAARENEYEPISGIQAAADDLLEWDAGLADASQGQVINAIRRYRAEETDGSAMAANRLRPARRCDPRWRRLGVDPSDCGRHQLGAAMSAALPCRVNERGIKADDPAYRREEWYDGFFERTKCCNTACTPTRHTPECVVAFRAKLRKINATPGVKA